jgi:L-seryl-tRNA(Ser) seleniumtransferase
MKVAKEQIVGMVAAVDWFTEQSEETMQAEFRSRASKIGAHLRSIPSLQASIVVPEVANHVPHLVLDYDHARVKIAASEVADQLRRGTPSIELNPATGKKNASGLTGDKDSIVVGVWMLQPGEDMIVARALHHVLSNACDPRPA